MQWPSLSSDELLEACLGSGGEPAWEEFVRRSQPVIARTVMRTGASTPQLIDDLVQETYLKIFANNCRILRDFQPQVKDAIFGLLKTIAFSVANDHLRSGLAQKRGAGRPEIALDAYAAQAMATPDNLPQAERTTLLRQIDDILKLVADPATGTRDQQIFWFYYRHGMTSRDIAAIPDLGLTQKGVESVIQRVTQHVRERLVGDPPEGRSSANPL